MRNLCSLSHCCSVCFVVAVASVRTSTREVDGYSTTVTISGVNRNKRTVLFSTPQQPPQQRQPRRDLQKRPRKGRKSSISEQDHLHVSADYSGSKNVFRQSQRQQQQEDFPWETAESRTIISAAAREAGEDYWIDIDELQRVEEQEALERKRQHIKRTTRDPNRMSDQKLWIEVLSPYKQNWIGLISVSMIVFAFIFKYFPEVIDPPIISNIPAML